MPAAELLDAHQSVLVVIDMQQRLLDAIPSPYREELIKHCRWLIHSAQRLNIPILTTEQYPKGLGKTDEKISAILNDTPVIEKTCFSCSQSNSFTKQLTALNRQQVVLCGVETHVCVLQTAYELSAKEYQVFLAEDATASRSEHHHSNALSRLANIKSATPITISNVESVMFEWLRDASHSEFKNISKLLK